MIFVVTYLSALYLLNEIQYANEHTVGGYILLGGWLAMGSIGLFFDGG